MKDNLDGPCFRHRVTVERTYQEDINTSNEFVKGRPNFALIFVLPILHMSQQACFPLFKIVVMLADIPEEENFHIPETIQIHPSSVNPI